MTIQFDKRLFLILSFAFIIATIIGTLSHEFGHYIVAKSLGYKTSIHYDYTHCEDDGLNDSINAIAIKFSKELETDASFPGIEKFHKLVQKNSNNNLWISIGGPFQTLLTGTIGLLLLFVWKRSFNAGEKLKARQWALIFIALFWLRQSANMIVWLATFILTKHFPYLDEIGIARAFGFPFWLLVTITGTIGMIILYIVIFKFIPRQQRLTFVLSGIVGGVAGYMLWLILLGPVLIP